MHESDLILTLTIGLGAALFLGYLTHRLGLSPIVGYLLAGVAVGPNTPGFVANKELAGQLAEIGVILLMFGVGLNFHFKELMAVRRVAVPGALVQSLVTTVLGSIVAVRFGWGWPAGLMFGLAISVASTVVLLRILVDNNDLHTPAGHIAVGWLVVEDLFTVFVLVLLPVVARTDSPGAAAVALAVGSALLKMGLLVVFIVLVGGRLLPRLLAGMAATRSRELFTLSVLVLALGIALGAARLFDASMALGAFLAGMVVGRSDFSSRAAAEAMPMRDAFAVLFFVSVGMLFSPDHLVAAPRLVAATLGIILVGKPLAALLIMLVLRHPPRTALAVAVALAQIGEFSFILAALGRQLGILSDQATNAVIAAAIVSISLNPVFYRLIDVFAAQAKRWDRLWSWLSQRALAPAARSLGATAPDSSGRRTDAVIVGYGPVGRTLVRLLRDNGIEPTIIELNLDTVRSLRAGGFRAVYGDATHKATLAEAETERAMVFILSGSGMHGSGEAIRLAREANPKIRVFARATHLREVPALRHAGADVVFSGEGELALSMTEFLMRQLGATAEQIDREKDRIRTELFGGRLSLAALFSPAPAAEPGDDEALSRGGQPVSG
ncbi:MAG: cation:proton antiporter [Candidatus Schekmanbacteria bacterium]|nr:cation:proton antiporter [Candidatus Schekmanbacteria bacterium]